MTAPSMTLEPGPHATLMERFAWEIPRRFNIGAAVCDRWADGSGRPALISEAEDGRVSRYSYDELKRASNRLANVLKAHGADRGERVGVLLSQGPETAIAHIAVYKMGAVAVPLFTLFGEEALEHRLFDSGARAVVTDRAGAEKLAAIRDRLPELRAVFSIDGSGEAAADLWAEMDRASDEHAPADTAADDPALIIYTSGTTGQPKGALHAHRVLLGHLPGVQMSQDFLPRPGDLFWTPADWAWIGGLLDVLLPALYFGVPVLARRFAKFDPEAAVALIERHGVRNLFMPPTALRFMRTSPALAGRRTPVRSIGSGGESLGSELLDWGRETFGVTIAEFYGQTECNMIVCNAPAAMPARPGWMGRPVPGHRVAVVGEAGETLPPGALGQIAVRRPDPVMFLGYWNNPEATAAKFAGDWLLTGDRGIMDEEGCLRFVGRDDDVITSAGYRIGPGEIEDCLTRHEAVALAAVVGVPDPVRTERVKAFVVLREARAPSPELTADIQAFVRARLAAHEYPREIAFVDSLPTTTTGKVIRRHLRER